jgi:hypothetical protein
MCSIPSNAKRKSTKSGKGEREGGEVRLRERNVKMEASQRDSRLQVLRMEKEATSH